MASLSFGCGCVDAPLALVASKLMNANYKMADAALANSLASLGRTVNDGYSSMSDGAMDVEKITRLKREQAIILKKIIFATESSNSHIALHNVAAAKSVESDLIKAEKNAVLKAIILNKNSPYSE